jgi:hypothetical protein
MGCKTGGEVSITNNNGVLTSMAIMAGDVDLQSSSLMRD